MRDYGKVVVAKLLEGLNRGLSVTSIPTSAGRTADLLVTGGPDGYFIEVKSKHDALGSADAPHQQDGISLQATDLEKTNRMREIFDDALEQLRTTDSTSADFPDNL